MPYKFTVDDALNGIKAEVVLNRNGVSRRLITKLKRIENGIMRGGEKIRTIDICYAGDVIEIADTADSFITPSPHLDVPCLYEDDDLVVFDKPPLMPCHPSIKHQGDTLANYFSYYAQGKTFRCINRLDRNTSGCCIVAKSSFCATLLQKSYDKTYYAVCCGYPGKSGRIDVPIMRAEDSIILRKCSPHGDRAITDFETVACNNMYSLVNIKLQTGRTHQIRVHFAHMGYPLAGDDMYGGNCRDISRQALHCQKVKFTQPVTKKTIIVTSQLPQDIAVLVANSH